MPKGDKFKLKADPDDGTTPIANLLLEAVAIADLNGTEKGVILYLWRQTYGWQVDGKRLKETTLGQETLAATFSCSARSIYTSLKNLTDKNILLRKDIGQGKGYRYQMNTNIATWNSHSINLGVLKYIAGVEVPIKGSQFLLPSTETSTPAGDNKEIPNVNEHGKEEGLPKVLPSTETSTPPLKKTSGPTSIKENVNKDLKKDIYGEFSNILLAKTEYGKLIEKFGTEKTSELIERLSSGIASKGYKYKSHYATILNWDNLDKKKSPVTERSLIGGKYHGTSPGFIPQPKGSAKPIKYIEGDEEEPPADNS